MPAIKATDDGQQWQTFTVIGGVISRDKAGQIEGMLELAEGVMLTFICNFGEAHWTWLPEEPEFTPDPLENDDEGML